MFHKLSQCFIVQRHICFGYIRNRKLSIVTGNNLRRLVHTPPKPPEDFAKAYPRKPLYWNAYGTNLFDGTRTLINYWTAISLTIYAAIFVFFIYFVPTKDLISRKYDIFDTDEKVDDMDFFNFGNNIVSVNVNNPDRIRHIYPKNDNKIDSPDNAFLRSSAKRDFTQLSFKDADQLLQQEIKKE